MVSDCILLAIIFCPALIFWLKEFISSLYVHYSSLHEGKQPVALTLFPPTLCRSDQSSFLHTYYFPFFLPKVADTHNKASCNHLNKQTNIEMHVHRLEEAEKWPAGILYVVDLAVMKPTDSYRHCVSKLCVCVYGLASAGHMFTYMDIRVPFTLPAADTTSTVYRQCFPVTVTVFHFIWTQPAFSRYMGEC